MLKTKLTELLGIKHPSIQAGMGPFSNNNLCVASANAGATKPQEGDTQIIEAP